ncbi:prenyltransferase/squalene oxidase repeat-containing protein [Paenibacillus agilis]|uniref:Squalene--hopene cyclase n=1 Tax=Paenibacillus agilis TaxID=3020863 RepID=A0A559J1A9_9BACL|nr:prenyltransferase/squalene oxidase repeat-containing protein [Paenibacillus agilis]TVX93626.1 squalene--hopene cyclase [Paenibacillus agilis]
MNRRANIESGIDRLIQQLLMAQAPDGSWRFCFESGTMTDSYMIIIVRVLQLSEDELVKQLSQRIVSRQHPEGYWSVYPNETNGNLSSTVEAYYALLYSGTMKKDDPILLKAKAYILSNGGMQQANSVLTKTMLAATGQRPWPRSYTVPIEFLLLPEWSPISFYDIVGYARVHIAPILIMSSLPDTTIPEGAPDLSDLILPNRSWEYESESFNHTDDIQQQQCLYEDYFAYDFSNFQSTYNSVIQSGEAHRSLLQNVKRELFQLLPSPQSVKQEARNKAESFMLDRIEPNGTLYSYASATFLMIFALLALGYDRNHPRITKAIQGLKSFVCPSDKHWHIQNSPPTIWDTALISHAFQQAGLPVQHGAIQRAGAYLLSRQQHKFGDWQFHNPNTPPGGWGFSDINTIIPDIDDTTAALRAINKLASSNTSYAAAYDKGLQWLLSMQNDDGGWPAFEKNTNKTILTWLPYDGANAALTDPSTADLTGRTLEYLGSTAQLKLEHAFVRRGADWLMNHQQQDGSWYGKWGISYIYGTWAAVTGLAAVGVDASNPALVRAARWLSRIQNQDGGWGESCESDRKKTYIPLHLSTPSQTAWALDALIAVSPQPTEEIERGIQNLLYMLQHPNKQSNTYPTGAGLPGNFYIYYHSYNYIWPLLTLANYKRKYSPPLG